MPGGGFLGTMDLWICSAWFVCASYGQPFPLKHHCRHQQTYRNLNSSPRRSSFKHRQAENRNYWMGFTSQVKHLLTSPRHFGKSWLLTISHENRQAASPSCSAVHVCTMAVLEVSTRSKRCMRTGKTEQLPQDTRQLQTHPGQAAAGHRTSCSHSRKASPEPVIKFNLQLEGWHMSSLPSAFRMFLLLQLQVQSPFYSCCILAAEVLL